MGRTSLRSERVKQHVPKSIRSVSQPIDRSALVRRCREVVDSGSYNQVVAFNSAIGQHLMNYPVCASHYNDSMFTVIAKCRSALHFSINIHVAFRRY